MSTRTLRPATPADLPAVAAIQFSDPGPAIIGLAGTRRGGRRLGEALMAVAGVTDPDLPTLVYEVDGAAIGFLQYSIGPPPEPRLGPALARRVVGALGFRIVLLPRRLKALRVVSIPAPLESLYLSELHVRPDLRGRGLGGEMLTWVEGEAARRGCLTISLVTDIGNPAQKLYERHGFVVAETRTDASYRRYTGREGRILMTRSVG